MNNAYGRADVVQAIQNTLTELKKAYPQKLFVFVEGPSDEAFYSFVFPPSSGLWFINVDDIIKGYKALRKRDYQEGKIYNCDIIREVIARTPDCYGIVDRDYTDGSTNYSNLIVTDACDLETTRIWSCPTSYFDLLSSVAGPETSIGNYNSIGTDALSNSIQLFYIRDILQNYPQIPFGLAFKMDSENPNHVKAALLSASPVFKPVSLIGWQRRINRDDDCDDYDINDQYCELQAEIEDVLFQKRRPNNPLHDPADGLKNDNPLERLKYWSKCRGHDYFFFSRALCPRIQTHLNQLSLQEDSLGRQKITLETVFEKRASTCDADLRKRILDAFMETSMGKRLIFLSKGRL